MRSLDDASGMTDAELLRAVQNARQLKREAETTVVTVLLQRGWSLRGIARELGLDHRTVSAWVGRDTERGTDTGTGPEPDTSRDNGPGSGPGDKPGDTPGGADAQ